MEAHQVWFQGDPHGDFRRVVRLALERKPKLIVFLGDLELPAPFEEVFYPVIKYGKTALRAVHGNHDADDEDLWRRMHDGVLAERFNLHGRVETFDGLRIAGLGGLFRSRIWNPPEEPSWVSYEEFSREGFGNIAHRVARPYREAFKASELLVHRSSIFPDVYERLARLETDVLVTHEAPGGPGFHEHGHPAIFELGERMRAQHGFCGHHHLADWYPKPGHCQWINVDRGEIVQLDGQVVE